MLFGERVRTNKKSFLVGMIQIFNLFYVYTNIVMQYLHVIGYNSHIYKVFGTLQMTHLLLSLCVESKPWLVSIGSTLILHGHVYGYHVCVYTQNVASQFTGCR